MSLCLDSQQRGQSLPIDPVSHPPPRTGPGWAVAKQLWCHLPHDTPGKCSCSSTALWNLRKQKEHKEPERLADRNSWQRKDNCIFTLKRFYIFYIRRSRLQRAVWLAVCFYPLRMWCSVHMLWPRCVGWEWGRLLSVPEWAPWNTPRVLLKLRQDGIKGTELPLESQPGDHAVHLWLRRLQDALCLWQVLLEMCYAYRSCDN